MTDLEKRVIEALRAKWFLEAGAARTSAVDAEAASDRERAIALEERGDVYETAVRELGNALDAAKVLADLGCV